MWKELITIAEKKKKKREGATGVRFPRMRRLPTSDKLLGLEHQPPLADMRKEKANPCQLTDSSVNII